MFNRCPDTPDIIMTKHLTQTQRYLISPKVRPGYQLWQILDDILLVIEAKLGCGIIDCEAEGTPEEDCNWVINQVIGYSLLFSRRGAKVLLAVLTDFCCKKNLERRIREVEGSCNTRIHVEVIDNLRPDNEDAIKKFHEIIRSSLDKVQTGRLL